MSGTCGGRELVLEITCRPSRPDLVMVRYIGDGTREEVALADIVLTRLEERTGHELAKCSAVEERS